MMNIRKFVSKSQRVSADAARQLYDHINAFSDVALPAQARAAMLNALHRHAHDDRVEPIWQGGFTMISREETAFVWDAIRTLRPEDRPGHVRHAFDLVLLNVRKDTGEVMLTRDEFAGRIGCSPSHVSNIMATLERLGVIRRERRRLPGVRGPGMVVYFINPHIGWNGSLELRRREAASVVQPSLRLVGGTSHPASPPA